MSFSIESLGANKNTIEMQHICAKEHIKIIENHANPEKNHCSHNALG